MRSAARTLHPRIEHVTGELDRAVHPIHTLLRLTVAAGLWRGSGLLCRHGLRGGNDIRCGACETIHTFLNDLGNGLGRAGQAWDGRVWCLEIQRTRQISHLGAPPRAQVWHFRTESHFQESQHGSVIEQVRRYKSSSAEWRNDQHWHAES